jgi:type IV pilus assembly protein PilC
LSKVSANDIAEFYRQMSILVRSGLPLPESVYQLGEGFSKKEFKNVLFDLSGKLKNGYSLSDAMKEFPHYFTDFHITMIETAEESEMLPEVLEEIAQIEQVNHSIIRILKESSVYPLFGIWFSIFIFFSMLLKIVPKFKRIFSDMLGEDCPLPALTNLIIYLSDLTVKYYWVNVFILILIPVVVFYLFRGTAASNRLLLKIASFLPGMGRIVRNLDLSRIASLWSFMMKNNIPADKALLIISGLTRNRTLSRKLETASENIMSGMSVADAFEAAKFPASLIIMIFKHIPEAEIADELHNISDIYKNRAGSFLKFISHLWNIIFISTFSVVIATVVIAMFLPLITVVRKLGGC